MGSGEDVAGGDETAPTGVPPSVIPEVLKRDLQKDLQSALRGCPALLLPPLHLPRSKLTCQGQLLGTASSPPTTLADRLGGKVGSPQLEAGERGECQVSGLAFWVGGDGKAPVWWFIFYLVTRESLLDSLGLSFPLCVCVMWEE